MAICRTREEKRRQRRNQLDGAAKSTPSTYNHDSEDMGVAYTDVSDGGFGMISVASPSTAPPFSVVAPPSVRDSGLPRLFGLCPGVVADEHVCYWTEKYDNIVVDLQAAIHDYNIDALPKTQHARSLQRREPTASYENVHEKKSSAMGKPNAGVYGDDDDDEALLCAKNTESCGNALLDPTAAEHDPWGGLGDGPVVITYGTVSVGSTVPNKSCPHGGPHDARLGR
ncbi:uncharacterized protein [Dermacentor andersoni]|uniref:uncharacterized protein n=1 Tax=Dermacentor andersoni TaxID=34620 RepID=UPI002155DADB|nr:uncharacterized protein LOC126541694 [Dermacentor andersoni]